MVNHLVKSPLVKHLGCELSAKSAQAALHISGLYYKHMTIVNDSNVVCEHSF
jgi:hypothetical protein